MRKIWELPGGVHPPENKTQSNSSPIEKISLPSEIVIPLNQHIGAPAICNLAVGDTVLKGQKIAEAEGLVSAPVHASTSGTIVAIEDRPIAHPSGLSSLCVVIQPDGQDTWVELEACENYLNETKEVLTEKIRSAGITGMGGAGFPTAVKLSPKANQKIETLILNGTECEPYITADDVLMRERADEIVLGAELLSHILGNPKIIIGIEDNKPEAVNSMREAAAGKNIEVVQFPTKYPSGGEKQLIFILTGKEVPSGGIPAEIGIVVQNVGTAQAAYRAARYGEPLISRITTVVGQSLTKQGNIETPIGTPIKHILNEFGFDSKTSSRLVIGGPMMGFTLSSTEAPVVKTTNCVLAPTEKEMPAPFPASHCIRCGMCSEACPASLLPQQLYWYSQAENFDALKDYHLFDCIECGACSYVCPSSIPLVQYYRASKGTMRQLEAEKNKSDHSRQRFEFRKERIAKAEAEKEAKRQARKAAAEKAKSALADKPKATPKPTENTESDLEKLERAITSAQLRVENAKQKLEEASANQEDETRLEALRAKLKQAEQKLLETNKRKSEALEANTTLKETEEKIVTKIQASPTEKLEKSLESLRKRLETAKQKLAEAEASESPTVAALKTGVEKLQQKLTSVEEELKDARSKNDSTENPGTENASLSAAEVAIERAKAKAAAQANMSEEEKARANIASLESRLSKAKERLEKAKAENSEHLEAFSNSVEKLEIKLKQAKETMSENA